MEEMNCAMHKRPRLVKALNAVNKLLTGTVYLAYPALLVFLAMHQDVRFFRVLITAGASFVLVSLFRSFFNAPRPYEVLDIVPLISKDTKGKSFPSRHVFSIFVIAMCFCYISLPIGIVLLAAGALLAAVRVIVGVHFPRDVIAGAVIGILAGVIGLYIA